MSPDGWHLRVVAYVSSFQRYNLSGHALLVPEAAGKDCRLLEGGGGGMMGTQKHDLFVLSALYSLASFFLSHCSLLSFSWLVKVEMTFRYCMTTVRPCTICVFIFSKDILRKTAKVNDSLQRMVLPHLMR